MLSLYYDKLYGIKILMKNSHSHELPFRRVTYSQLDALHEGVIGLTVPVLQDKVLIHSYDENDGYTTMNVDVHASGTRMSLARDDRKPFQVFDVESNRKTDVFSAPIDRLGLYKDQTGLWLIQIDQGEILHPESAIDLIEITAMFALSKQARNRHTNTISASSTDLPQDCAPGH